MHTNSTYINAIIDFHDRGFCDDFVLFGNDLFWIQGKSFINEDSFSISECHQFAHPLGNDQDLVIFGIIVFSQKIKGILMNHYSYSSPVPGIITEKLNEMGFFGGQMKHCENLEVEQIKHPGFLIHNLI